MVTVASACLGALLAWLAASDSRLPWPSSRDPQSPRSKNTTNQQSSTQHKTQNNNKQANSKTKIELDTLHGFLRLAAYAAIAALMWSWSPDAQHQLDNHVHSHSAVSSFRVDIDPASLSSNNFPHDSDANRTATGGAQTGDGQGSPLFSSDDSEEAREAAHAAAIHNATLGFEKIFVVNLPERADKRDALSLVSALTDIKLTWTSALRGTSVPDKALPLGVDRNGWRDGGIGSWRSQMNVIRTLVFQLFFLGGFPSLPPLSVRLFIGQNTRTDTRSRCSMVEENISSALILEDDADWDVSLKDQLAAIAHGTRILLDMAHNEPAIASKLTPAQRRLDELHSAHSPYGHGWDLLWLGHCGETFPERIPGHHEIHDRSSARYTYYAMEDDETLPADPGDVTESWISGDLARHRGTRWVHFSGGPTCSQAYALSQSGARKVLLALSVGGTLVEQLDNAMSLLCRDHTPWDDDDEANRDHPPGYPGANMRCLSVNPAVFSQHKPRGRMAAGSDIETLVEEDGEEAIREEGESPNLVLSARLNVQNLMMGRPLQAQKVKTPVKKNSSNSEEEG